MHISDMCTIIYFTFDSLAIFTMKNPGDMFSHNACIYRDRRMCVCDRETERERQSERDREGNPQEKQKRVIGSMKNEQ